MATANDVIAGLRARYAPPEWAFLEQVANATGGRASRTADAVAMNLWPSRGCEIHGFEVKVSRSDWLTELKNPAKADEVARFCDRWWLTVSSLAIIQNGERPAAWGLIVVESGNARVVVEAAPLEPAPLTRAFLGSVLRRATQQVTPEAIIRARVDEAVAVERAAWEARAAESRERVEGYEDSYRLMVDRFQKASGINLRNYDGPTLPVELVRYLSNPGTYGDRLRHIAEQLKRLSDEANKAATEMRGKPRAF